MASELLPNADPQFRERFIETVNRTYDTLKPKQLIGMAIQLVDYGTEESDGINVVVGSVVKQCSDPEHRTEHEKDLLVDCAKALAEEITDKVRELLIERRATRVPVERGH